jgi:membrane protease YdiL (CAAX protease family)
MSERKHWWKAIGGLSVALGVPALPLSRWTHEFKDASHLVSYELVWWSLSLAIVLYTIYVERRPLRFLGMKPFRFRDLALGIATGAGTFVLLGFLLFTFSWLQTGVTSAAGSLVVAPLWRRLISTVRAAFAEELLFRGYATSRLQDLTRKPKLAGLLSCAIFTAEHIPVWGWTHLVLAGCGGLALTATFLWKRNLWIVVMAHFVVDGASLLFA